MSNPLVAAKEDSTTWHSGINVLDDAAGVYQGVQSGSWVEGGIAAFGTAMDLLTIAMNPVGTLISYGLNWLIEHVKPLQDALNKLAGDADQIAAYSKTWGNIGQAVEKAAKDLAATVEKDTANWTGQAADTYRANLKDKIDHLNAAATCANTIGTVVQIVGVITAAVRGLVRDMVTQAVGDFIQDALEEVCSLGLGTPAVVAQVVEQVSAWMEKIGALIKKLINSVEALRPMMSKLEEIFAAIKKVMAALHGHAGGEEPHLSGDGSTHASSAVDEPHTTPGGEEPRTTTDDGTHPSDAADTPDGTGSGDTTPSSTSDGSLRNGAEDPRDVSQQPIGRCGKREPVDMATGEMFMVQTDLRLPGTLPLVLERVHVSSYRAGRSFGASWASTMDQRLESDERGFCYAGPDGVILVYPVPPADGRGVLPAEGARWPLSRTADGFEIDQVSEGHTLRFEAGQGATAPLSSIVDRNGNRIEFDRDTRGVVREIRHSGGYRITVESEAGLVTGLSLGAPGEEVALVQYGYDDARRLVEVVNSSGLPVRFSYDAEGRITKWTDRNERWYGYTYDASGRCVRTEGSANALAGLLDYDPAARVTRETDSLGNVSLHHFNELNQLIRQVDPLGNETTFEWDRYDRLLSTTDPLGFTTRHSYDESGNLVATTRPDGTQALASYNEHGLPANVVNPDGSAWRHEYDERGNLVGVVDPTGAATRYHRNERGGLIAVTDALGHVHRIETDPAGLPVAVTDPSGATTRYRRDGFGRVVEAIDPLGAVTRLRWTVEGRLEERTMPDGSAEHWRYDAEGNMVEHTDALGQVSRTAVGVFNLPVAETGPDGARTEFAYDSELRLVAVTNAQGLVWRYDYDEAGRLVRESDYNGRELRYSNDAAGRVVERVNGAGERTAYRRNEFGFVVEQRAGDSATHFGYDVFGRLARARNQDAEISYVRDPLGRVLAETCNGLSVLSRYDRLGRRVYRRTPSGAESTWEYGAGERPAAVTTAGRRIAFGYDAAGQEIERTLGEHAALVQTWDVNRRLHTQSVTAEGTAAAGRGRQLLQRRAYTYRPDGFVTAVVDQLSGPRTFELDPAGHATAVRGTGWTERYTYSPAGDVTSVHWADGSGGDFGYAGTLIRRAGTVRYEQDGQGRVVLRQQRRLSAKPRTWRYHWSSDDRMTGVSTPDGVRWRYRYDPLGRRIAKERLGADGVQVVERTGFTWDGSTMTEQIRTGAGADPRVTTWAWEPGSFRPVTQVERVPVREAPQEWFDERFRAIVTDLAGSPAELLGADGELVWSARTTLWGAPRTGDEGPTPLRLPGQYFDAETGLHYNHHRYYDPHAGRYLSADPLGLAPGPNNQAYVANPLTLVDPLGLVCDPAPEAPTIERDNYRGRFFAAQRAANKPEMPANWDVHHRIPQMYRGHPEFSDFDFDAPDNLIGVPGNRVGTGPANVHQGITNNWNDFARANPNASRAEIEAFADRIDGAYQGFYWHW